MPLLTITFIIKPQLCGSACNVLLTMAMQFQESTANSHVTGDRIRIGCKTNCLILIKNWNIQIV